MTIMDIVIDPRRVNEILEKHGVAVGSVPIEAALMQYEGTDSGQPALMLLIDVDGKKLIAKTSLRLMEAACRAMRAASGITVDGDLQKPVGSG
jgi:hypothetical protein